MLNTSELFLQFSMRVICSVSFDLTPHFVNAAKVSNIQNLMLLASLLDTIFTVQYECTIFCVIEGNASGAS